MFRSKFRRNRGGVLVAVVAGAAVVSLAAVAALSFAPTSPSSSTKHAAKPRQTPPAEIAAVLYLTGLDPEVLASAGVTGLGCDGVFDVANGYCLQADRLDQIRIASSAVNQAKDRAVHPPPWQGETPPPPPQVSVAQAQGTLDDLKNSAFTFVTATLTQGQIAKLTVIRANAHWNVSTPYLLVNRTDAQWMALRGALANQRYSQTRGVSMAPDAVQTLAAADADPVVIQAKQDLASKLTAVKQSWNSHAHPVSPPPPPLP